jgi:hypothetical protein
MELSEAATRYAELGYPVFPCVPGTKKPLTPNGFKDATTDVARIEAWWSQFPAANVAIAAEGLLVLDVDGPDNPWLRGDERLMDLARGPVAQTPRGGRHHVFRQPHGRAWRSTESRLAPHIDTRADGGYFLVAPSKTENGMYRWLPDFELTDSRDKLPEPPAWLVELLDNLPAPSETTADGGNPIPLGQRNGTLARLAGTLRRAGMTQTEILAGLAQANQDRCQPPLEQAEVARIAQSIARYTPDQITVALIEDHWGQQTEAGGDTLFASAYAVCQEYPSLRKAVIHGLLREGETMNVIAAPKAGKSWLVQNLALSVATGQPWLGFPAEHGRVLLLDNELHSETLADRIRRVTQALQLPAQLWKDTFFVRSLRGQLEDLFRMESYFHSLPEGFFKLVVLDAFYRFMPREMDENDNGTMANLYNVIDRCARRLSCAFVLIHHTTKGVQSAKSVTDVGSGGGAQSRATDCHFILRPHQQDACLVVEAVTRSWPSPLPFVIRQAFPLWHPDPSLDPEDLKRAEHYARSRAFGQQAGPEPEADSAEPETEWTIELFAESFLRDAPRLKALILVDSNERGLTDYAAEKLLEKGLARGLIHRWALDHNRVGYATAPQPTLPLDNEEQPNARPSKREQIETILRASPDLGNREIARQCHVAHSFVNRIRKELGL